MNLQNDVIHVTTYKFDEEVLRSPIPVVVDFFADWCGPCKMLAPHLERMAAEFAGKVKVVKVNVDEEADLAGRYGVSGIPTLIFFKDGREVDTVVGLLPPGILREKMSRAAAAPASVGR